MLSRPYKTYITKIGAFFATSATGLVLFAGIAAACEGGGGGGGGCAAPTVSTGSATSITSNSATLDGTVNPNGCETFYAFEYGRSSEGYPNEVEGKAGNGTSPKSVSTSSPLGLEPSTSYHFRLSAWNSGGETTGGSSPFTTTPACPKPTVTTEAASSITPYSATMNGSVNPQGCEIMFKFEWGESSWSNYPYIESGFVKGTSSVKVSKPAAALEPGKSYHFRLSATVGGVTTYGSEKIFTATPLTDYVALGDSYSSGTGTGTFVEPSCYQSIHSYPWLLHNAHPEWFFIDAACHGAETSNLINFQANALTEHTKWVTYTIGGNDAKFSPVLKACYGPFGTAGCTTAMDEAENFIEKELAEKLDKVNNKIKERAKYAKVIVLDYPHIFNGEDCNVATWFDEAEMIRINALVDKVAEKLKEAATRAGSNFKFTNVIPIFDKHAVCDPPGFGTADEWINGASSPEAESYHPKIIGHAQGYYPMVLGVTG